MATVDYAPGSTASGALGTGGGGGGNKGDGGGGDPPRGHYNPKGGDTNNPLWLYDLRTATSYLQEYCKSSLTCPKKLRQLIFLSGAAQE
jgi:hypothetical protein